MISTRDHPKYDVMSISREWIESHADRKERQETPSCNIILILSINLYDIGGAKCLMRQDTCWLRIVVLG